MKPKLQIKRLHESAILPTRAQPDDAGLDLHSVNSVFIPIGGTVRIPTGISVATSSGTYIKIEDRSGMAAKGLRTGAGVVDPTYTGEISVVLHNLNNGNNTHFGLRGYQVNAGDRIAQMVQIPILLPVVEEVFELQPTARGDSGFGSTGR